MAGNTSALRRRITSSACRALLAPCQWSHQSKATDWKEFSADACLVILSVARCAMGSVPLANNLRAAPMPSRAWARETSG